VPRSLDGPGGTGGDACVFAVFGTAEFPFILLIIGFERLIDQNRRQDDPGIFMAVFPGIHDAIFTDTADSGPAGAGAMGQLPGVHRMDSVIAQSIDKFKDPSDHLFFKYSVFIDVESAEMGFHEGMERCFEKPVNQYDNRSGLGHYIDRVRTLYQTEIFPYKMTVSFLSFEQDFLLGLKGFGRCKPDFIKAQLQCLVDDFDLLQRLFLLLPVLAQPFDTG